ncbi:pentatricopeptide repeat-containing protein [Canna indica]|uniref:Pentatricopeptide repeat-containing protein n=1 Tax=Canna indica TaxID=4628 RepID=A0AAQ3KDT0_9LILI|nr:pentatricopeptide repeat-containing protein [Canna indica]
MFKTNLSRWVALINRSSRQGRHQDALQLFHQMRSQGFAPDLYILPSLLRACARLPAPDTGRSLHAVVLRSASPHDAFVCSALIDMYCKCGRVPCARQVFDETLHKDLVVWNSMVSGYAQRGAAEAALLLSVKMKSLGAKPDLVTWNALISGFAREGDDGMAMDLLSSMQSEDAEPDVFSWTSIITGLVFNFKYSKAFEIFGHMVKIAGVRPSSVTISSLLPACANVVDLRRGKQIHGYALVAGTGEDLYVGSALIDMYTKCGLVFEAKKVFDDMYDRNTVSWNSMIFGYANHGYCKEAIDLFNRMKIEGVRLDHQTFTAALSACSHGGMVKLGRNLFRSMQEEHRVEPRLEHYACVVDMLGRAGELMEACNLIAEMPMEADAFVWGALLGASRNHGNLELAELAASHLFKLEPESAGSCVLLSNVLAGAGRQGDALKLKKLVKRKKMITLTGCSWMQVA